jgi:CheY-like chemotaxis protein
MLRLHRVDLVVSEQFLSDLTGAQLADNIKQLKPNLPIALLVGANAAGGSDADVVITVGTYPDEVLAAIESLASPRTAVKSHRY